MHFKCIFALDSAVVDLQKMLSLHGGFTHLLVSSPQRVNIDGVLFYVIWMVTNYIYFGPENCLIQGNSTFLCVHYHSMVTHMGLHFLSADTGILLN